MRVTADFAPLWEIGEFKASIPGGTGAAVPQKGKKRSRSIHTGGYEDEDHEPSPDPRNRHDYRPVDVKDQYYVAGHDPSQIIPSASFPHSPIPGKRGAPSANESEDAFASLNPPLHAVPPSRQVEQASLQRQHVAVMTSILHVSLLRGDYHRAGQAFGLLLRAAPSKTNINLKTGGAWGIGAEILLRQGDKQALSSLASSSSASEEPTPPSITDHDREDLNSQKSISADNIEKAKKYYESLILQYPFDKLNPQSTDARTFYPALFSLMIYEASEGSKAAMAALPTPSDHSSDSEDEASDHDSGRQAAATDIKRAELSRARAIASQIDDIIVSPPYDRFVPLLRMRGMVGLWEVDLLDAIIRAESNDQSSTDSTAAELVSSTRAKAMREFKRVKNRGGQLPDSILRQL
ncbi:hypothetical protein BDZ85DRAFT_262107 [Elsinoe ampelina]|uniref:Uncharacterized protein n=1 Tax=Elsinoe ampelina TaxID=302913 RepID=A0A6A6GDD5_9PEZI|nr:hypothetical protein BDZ85DRAFT_262107 [Elsinoe ampelina]